MPKWFYDIDPSSILVNTNVSVVYVGLEIQFFSRNIKKHLSFYLRRNTCYDNGWNKAGECICKSIDTKSKNKIK
jgi:hypothetical protein